MSDTTAEQQLKDLEHEYVLVHRQFGVAGAAALSLLAGGAVFYHLVDHFSWLNAFYFCTITLATVGYGDLVPTGPAAKLFTIFYVLVGVGMIAYFVNVLIRHAIVRRELRRIRRGLA